MCVYVSVGGVILKRGAGRHSQKLLVYVNHFSVPPYPGESCLTWLFPFYFSLRSIFLCLTSSWKEWKGPENPNWRWEMKRGEDLRGKDMKLISIIREKARVLNWVQFLSFLFWVVCLRLTFLKITIFGSFERAALKVTSSRNQVHLCPRFIIVTASVLAAISPLLLIPNLSSEFWLFPEMVL